MANRLTPLPKNPDVAEKVLQADADRHARDIGRVGYWLGSRNNAIIYIATLIIVLSVTAATILALGEPVQGSSLRADMAKAFAALALSALGYMFGAAGKSASQGD